VWILDGLEVTIVGSIGARLTETRQRDQQDDGRHRVGRRPVRRGGVLRRAVLRPADRRFGRKRLMILTLAVYICATVLTAFSFAPWFFFLCRFLTGAGIGGEYAAINSAIDELIPARNRGQVDITINGSYWVGSALGGGYRPIATSINERRRFPAV
jgi:MFS family permease